MSEVEVKDIPYFEFKKQEISDSIIDYVGISKEVINMVEVSKRIARLKMDKVINGDTTLDLRIKVEENKLKDIEALMDYSGDNFFSTKLALENKFGLSVNEHTSIKEFYFFVKKYNNE